jgi:hypothetical protein
VTELTDAIKERMNNSFSGPYTVFFMLFNWPAMVFVFTGEDSAQTRIDNITSYLSAMGSKLILVPLVATVAYIIFVPIIVTVIDWYKTAVHNLKQRGIEKIDRGTNGSWEHKFILVRAIANKLLLNTNSMISNGNQGPEQVKVLQKYINALIESGDKSLLQHFYELRDRKEI